MQKLKEAAEAARALSNERLKLDLLVRSEGIMAQAAIGLLEAYWLVSWEQISQSTINPLLAALSVVAETVKGAAINEKSSRQSHMSETRNVGHY